MNMYENIPSYIGSNLQINYITIEVTITSTEKMAY